ncbi:MAG: acetate--CoA ligase family protein [Anaerolineae bacterium]
MSAARGRMLPEPDAAALLAEYGIAYPEHAYVHNAREAAEAAGQLGYPVVLKVVSPEAIHKSDVGGVVLNVHDASSVLQAYEAIVRSVRTHKADAEVPGMLVCRQAPPGLEVIVGGLQDAIFGPALMFGLGGIFAEVLEDVTFRIAPIGPGDAKEMIQEIRGYPLLAGTRGQVGYDVEALADLLLAVSRMMAERAEIQELDLNPVRVYEQGLLALDARILLAADQQGVQ